MRFFVLEQPRGVGPYTTDYYDWEPVHLGEAPRCPSCGRFVGLLPWLPPYSAEIEVLGKEFGDIAFGPGCDLLVSARFTNLVREHCLRGFTDFEPVHIVRVRYRRRAHYQQVVPSYYHVNVRCTAAAVNQEASGLQWKRAVACSDCRQGDHLIRWKRLVLEEGTWSGEDVFEARGLPASYLVTERFKAICEKAGITNVSFVPAEEHSRDFYPDGTEP